MTSFSTGLSTFALHGAIPTHLAIQDANPEYVKRSNVITKNAPLTLIKWSKKTQKNAQNIYSILFATKKLAS